MSMWRKHKSGAAGAGLQDPLLRLEIQRWKMASMGGGGLLEKQRRMVEKLGLEPLLEPVTLRRLPKQDKETWQQIFIYFAVDFQLFSMIFNYFQ